MEADWEVEIGGDAPVIDAHWAGFVNVRDEPWRVAEVAETHVLPGLGAALLRLNQSGSAVWTSKADVFEPEQVDPDELGARKADAQFAIACYIDLLWRSDQAWNSHVKAEQDCRELCASLRRISLHCCRIDLVVRRAMSPVGNDLGMTVYFTACGPAPGKARDRLSACLGAFVGVIIPEP